MQTLIAFGTGAGLTGLLLTAGCFGYYLDDCELLATCLYGPSKNGSGGGGTGGVNAACVPSENDGAVAESCGVFASSSAGDDASDGTPEKPVKTLARAVELATSAGKPVYACAETFTEAVSMPAGAVLFGGLDCANSWRYVGATRKTSIEPAADASAPTQIALLVKAGAGTTRVEDVAVRAPSALSAGGSSIGALVDGASAEFARCELEAGDGKAGAPGETPSPVGPSNPTDDAILGKGGADACLGDAGGNAGGKGKANEFCETSMGGDGGAGKETMGDKGGDGQPVPAPNPDGWGLGGKGEGGTGCKVGEQGINGGAGAPGAGASSMGALTAAGYVAPAGEAGKAGTPGQGGGGGGGAKGKAGCNGASGGGGGAGGCGGPGGLGGGGGGASIALASVGATVVLKDVKLSSGKGGAGGEGGKGRSGSIGGAGGFGGASVDTLVACDGGKGGQGGFGGHGGGGRGGPSIGIAFTGAPPTTERISITTGEPGKGGLGADTAGDGAPGVNPETQEFAQASGT